MQEKEKDGRQIKLTRTDKLPIALSYFMSDIVSSERIKSIHFLDAISIGMGFLKSSIIIKISSNSILKLSATNG
ncbi:MAG: hypothetical protein NTX05_05200 [Fusobacteria bacterium]|nr:hypothetical protein [Fusobacteriota bacterium]